MQKNIDKELEDIFDEYLADLKNHTQNMEKSLSQNDFKSIRIVGHTLAGNGESYGLAEVSDLGSKLEQAALNLNGEQVQNHLSNLKTFLSELKIKFV